MFPPSSARWIGWPDSISPSATPIRSRNFSCSRTHRSAAAWPAPRHGLPGRTDTVVQNVPLPTPKAHVKSGESADWPAVPRPRGMALDLLGSLARGRTTMLQTSSRGGRTSQLVRHLELVQAISEATGSMSAEEVVEAALAAL